MNARITILSFLMLLFATTGFAQKGWNFSTDPGQAATEKEKNALYTDLLKQGSYTEALGVLQELMGLNPDLHKSLYQNEIKIYNALEKKDPSKKKEYRLKKLTAYEKRMADFGERSKLLDRYTLEFYNTHQADDSQLPKLYDLFQESFQVRGEKVSTNLPLAYFNFLKKYRKVSPGAVSDDKITEDYESLSELMGRKIANESDAKKKSRYSDYVGAIDGMYSELVVIDCDFVRNNLEPKFRANPSDVQMAKKVVGSIIKGGCGTGSALFQDAAQVVQANSPDYGLAKAIAADYGSKGDYGNAERYFNEALGLADAPNKRADVYRAMASIEQSKGSKSGARKYFLQAISEDPSTASQNYTAIGNMYFSSYNSCKKGISRVEDRGCYLAAHKMYVKAGNNSMAAKAKGQFPSREVIFSEDGKSEGQTMSVGCWIGETVTIKSR